MCQEYVVQDILRSKMMGGKVYYRVKWLGYKGENTWEPEENIPQDLILYYNTKVASRREVTRQVPRNTLQILRMVDGDGDGDGDLRFQVTEGGRSRVVGRRQLVPEHARKLAEFYIGLARERGEY